VKRFARLDDRECSACHPSAFADYIRTKPMYDGLAVTGESNYEESLNWDFVKKLQDTTTMKVLIKGIVTGEDTLLAVENGLDGVIVSNHGGRAENSMRGTIECLPEVVEAASGRLAVLVDGGFRRGTDIFKALALGADAVCIGRPYLWGLASFGQPGVEAVLDLLRKELVMVMKQMGTTTIAAIEKSSVVARPS
jgi:isopentenyl diphosphate isomerase/L-lactate dehydrogenase-like FMN-dependent dehydrogenase